MGGHDQGGPAATSSRRCGRGGGASSTPASDRVEEASDVGAFGQSLPGCPPRAPSASSPAKSRTTLARSPSTNSITNSLLGTVLCSTEASGPACRRASWTIRSRRCARSRLSRSVLELHQEEVVWPTDGHQPILVRVVLVDSEQIKTEERVNTRLYDDAPARASKRTHPARRDHTSSIPPGRTSGPAARSRPLPMAPRSRLAQRLPMVGRAPGTNSKDGRIQQQAWLRRVRRRVGAMLDDVQSPGVIDLVLSRSSTSLPT